MANGCRVIGRSIRNVRPHSRKMGNRTVERAAIRPLGGPGRDTVGLVMRVPRVPSLRSVRFLPLVFLIGIDGFALFAPYVIGVLALGYAIRQLRSHEAAPSAVIEPAEAIQIPV